MLAKVIAVIAVLFLLNTNALAVKNGLSTEKQAFIIHIQQPTMDKAKVGCEMVVKGIAEIPSGYYIWVLVHRTEGFEDIWWPQNAAKIDPITKRWTAHVVFGERQDISYTFEVAAIVVNEKEHNKLIAYRKQALKSGDWRPIDMPPTEAAPLIRPVIKVNHDGCR